MAVYDKITSADMLLHIPGLAKQLTSMVKTDMPLSDMIDLGRALHSMVKEKGLSMVLRSISMASAVGYRILPTCVS